MSMTPVMHRCEYLGEFLKKTEMALVVYLGTWGKVIIEKT
jgi:hypothetical protein